jgi:hypothetical protein
LNQQIEPVATGWVGVTPKKIPRRAEALLRMTLIGSSLFHFH